MGGTEAPIKLQDRAVPPRLNACQALQPWPSASNKSQTAGCAGQGLGGTTQDAQALLLQIVKFCVAALLGVALVMQSILQGAGDALVSVQWQLYDTASTPT